MDQTGVHLVSASSWTYEMVGSSDVAIVGAEDKRQITACVAASLRGDLLPLQLIFQGKTARSLPAATAASIAARVDITCSDNHWSTQETMQRWITNILLPHSERMINMHGLNANAHILLLLDCWAVHKSAEFRDWLQREHPRIHLVFVPANCTSKLQLADVVLQRPFKLGLLVLRTYLKLQQIQHRQCSEIFSCSGLPVATAASAAPAPASPTPAD